MDKRDIDHIRAQKLTANARPPDCPELDVHTHGVYRPEYPSVIDHIGALIVMALCAMSGFAVGLVVGWML